MFVGGFAASVSTSGQRWAGQDTYASSASRPQAGPKLRRRLFGQKCSSASDSKFFGGRRGLRWEARSAPVTVDVPDVALIRRTLGGAEGRVVQSPTRAEMEQISANKCFGGWVRRYQHDSTVLRGPMKFHVYLPAAALAGQKVPALYYLSGLTCTDENAVIKGGVFEHAARHSLAVVFPDTSPRAFRTPGDDASWDFGQGAGFYVDATERPWSEAYKMYTYVTSELPTLLEANLPLSSARSILGHSMGGHGALICFLKNPSKYKSVSAFAPITNPTACPWGIKAFTGYLGAENKKSWEEYDATLLIKRHRGNTGPEILIDQGLDDKFYKEKQLLPEAFEAAAKAAGVPVKVRYQEGYDHSYFFISTFVADHVAHHAKYLKS